MSSVSVGAAIDHDRWRMVITIFNHRTSITLDVYVGTSHQDCVELLEALIAGQRPIRRSKKYLIGDAGEDLLARMKRDRRFRRTVTKSVADEVKKLQATCLGQQMTSFLRDW